MHYTCMREIGNPTPGLACWKVLGPTSHVHCCTSFPRLLCGIERNCICGDTTCTMCTDCNACGEERNCNCRQCQTRRRANLEPKIVERKLGCAAEFGSGCSVG